MKRIICAIVIFCTLGFCINLASADGVQVVEPLENVEKSALEANGKIMQLDFESDERANIVNNRPTKILPQNICYVVPTEYLPEYGSDDDEKNNGNMQKWTTLSNILSSPHKSQLPEKGTVRLTPELAYCYYVEFCEAFTEKRDLTDYHDYWAEEYEECLDEFAKEDAKAEMIEKLNSRE